jgi:hypothetical protein
MDQSLFLPCTHHPGIVQEAREFSRIHVDLYLHIYPALPHDSPDFLAMS